MLGFYGNGTIDAFPGNWSRNFKMRKIFIKLIKLKKIRLILKLLLTIHYIVPES